MARTASEPTPGVPGLHLVTDDAILARPDFRDHACAVMEAGGPALALHVRGPSTPGRTLYSLVQELRDPAGASGTLLVVNDRVDIALAAGLRGAHLGERSLPVAEARRILGAGVMVGASVHDPAAASAAAADGSAWLFVGTLYRTPSHPDRAGLGSDAIRQFAAAAHVPIVGIGGITVAHVGEVRLAGAHGVAVIRGVWDAADPAGAVGDYLFALT
jgi:thiamine-phosphate diphosphorylase